jgi:hypothetical protein
VRRKRPRSECPSRLMGGVCRRSLVSQVALALSSALSCGCLNGAAVEALDYCILVGKVCNTLSMFVFVK